VAKKKKGLIRTPEERERQLENQRQMKRLLAQRLERDGATPEEIRRRVGPID
jgi:hypothetical protein